MRYQLAGYAWGKALIEDENSLVRFNEVLYALARADLTITSDEAALVQAAESVFVSVEDRPFSEWYAAQHVFDTSPPEGEFLFIRNSGVNNLWVAPFSRDASGVETTITDADIQWVVKDHAGSVIVRGSGAMIFDPVLSGYWSTMGYEGRIEITAEAVLSGQSRSSTVYDKASPSSAIFGVVLGADDGSITLTPLDGGTAVTAAVEKGTFQASDMTTVRGRVEYVFTDLAGVSTAPRVVTKDNAPYFLLIDVRGTPENDCPGHEPVPHKPHPRPRGGKHWRHPHKQ